MSGIMRANMNLETIPAAWIGVISALAGGLLVGLFALVSKWIDKTSESRAATLIKLEELHEALTGFAFEVQATTMSLLEEGSLFEVKEAEIGDILRDRLYGPLKRLRAIQRLYAPSLQPSLELVLDRVESLVRAAERAAATGHYDQFPVLESGNELFHAVESAEKRLVQYIFAQNLVPNQSRLQAWRAALARSSDRRLLPKQPTNRSRG